MEPTENASAYAYHFVNDLAPEYARDAIADGVTDEDSAREWVHETADSLSAVIYTGQATALYAAGIYDYEDDDLVSSAMSGDDTSAVARIDRGITALSYVWHARVLLEAITELLTEEGE